MKMTENEQNNQVSLVYYGAFIGLLTGILGTTWATLFFKYFSVETYDSVVEIGFWVFTVVLILVSVILIVKFLTSRNNN